MIDDDADALDVMETVVFFSLFFPYLSFSLKKCVLSASSLSQLAKDPILCSSVSKKNALPVYKHSSCVLPSSTEKNGEKYKRETKGKKASRFCFNSDF